MVGPEKCTTSEAYDRDYKIAFMNTLKVCEEEMNTFNKEIYGKKIVKGNE